MCPQPAAPQQCAGRARGSCSQSGEIVQSVTGEQQMIEKLRERQSLVAEINEVR